MAEGTSHPKSSSGKAGQLGTETENQALDTARMPTLRRDVDDADNFQTTAQLRARQVGVMEFFRRSNVQVSTGVDAPTDAALERFAPGATERGSAVLDEQMGIIRELALGYPRMQVLVRPPPSLDPESPASAVESIREVALKFTLDEIARRTQEDQASGVIQKQNLSIPGTIVNPLVQIPVTEFDPMDLA